MLLLSAFKTSTMYSWLYHRTTFFLFILIYWSMWTCCCFRVYWGNCMKNHANAVSKPFIFCRWSWLLVLLTSPDNGLYLSSQIDCVSVTFKVLLSSQSLAQNKGILWVNGIAPFSDWQLEWLKTSFIYTVYQVALILFISMY